MAENRTSQWLEAIDIIWDELGHGECGWENCTVNYEYLEKQRENSNPTGGEIDAAIENLDIIVDRSYEFYNPAEAATFRRGLRALSRALDHAEFVAKARREVTQ